ncbi:MAG: transcriptional regulator, AraC family [Bacteroidetes bacterium]|nr:transcriptional regulator, AraC family [Bacteroidota bacterium]
MNETFVIVIYSIATFSLSLISILTFFRRKKNQGYFWLCLVFFTPVIAFTNNILIYEYMGNPMIHFTSMFFNLSYGAYLIFTISYFKNNQKPKKWGWLFLPSYLYIPFIIFYLFDHRYVNEIVSGNDITGMALYMNSFYNLLIVLYSIGSNIWLWVKELKDISQTTNLISKSKIRKELLLVMLLLQLGAFVPYIFQLDAMYIILYMPVFGQLFFIYVFVRLSPNMFNELYDQQEKQNKGRYSGLKLEQQRIDEILSKIKLKMEKEKLYLNEECNLQSFSQLVNESPNIVSMIINQHYNTTFPDFLNQYRVQESIKMLSELKDKKYSIEGIAYECGFGNRTSFYNAFKKHTGMLPNEYRHAINEK